MFLYGEPCPPPDVVDIRIIRGAALVLQIHDELIVECVGIPDVIAAYVVMWSVVCVCFPSSSYRRRCLTVSGGV